MSEIITKAPESTMKSISGPTSMDQQGGYAQCCICRELPSIKEVWAEYMWNGETEVYGAILRECFSIIWPHDELIKYQICEVCIAQLRHALQFKKRIMHSYGEMLQNYKMGAPTYGGHPHVGVMQNSEGPHYDNQNNMHHQSMMENRSSLAKPENMYIDVCTPTDGIDHNPDKDKSDKKGKEKKSRGSKAATPTNTTPCSRQITKKPRRRVDRTRDIVNQHITEHERHRIVSLRQHGLSIAQICREMGIARNTVYLWLDRWENEGNLNECKKTGRRRKTTGSQDSNIIEQFIANPFSVTRTVANTHNVSLNTVRRRLKEVGMRTGKAIQKRKSNGTSKKRKPSNEPPPPPPPPPPAPISHFDAANLFLSAGKSLSTHNMN